MPVWQDVYRRKDAVRDVGEASERLADLASTLDSVDLVLVAGMLAQAFERLSNPRQKRTNAVIETASNAAKPANLAGSEKPGAPCASVVPPPNEKTEI
jgi:hypothetical protein